jgi:hypothetical protein
MSRHEIVNDKGKWVFGWDQPLLTFYLQLHDGDVEPDENPVIWLGTQPRAIYEVEELVADAGRNGLDIPHSMRVTLYGDKDDGK